MTNLRKFFLLSPHVVYLNHGSFGACPRPVFEAYQAWQRELERQPVKFFQASEGLLSDARANLADYVGTEANDLVFVNNATTGINIVAQSLRLEPQDEVLATNHEYGAIDRTWRFVCERSGAHYINQPIPVPIQSSEEVVEAIWSRVTARTKVLALSHITSPTALIFPLTELIYRAREANIITVIDGAHVPGQIPLNLDALEADFYSGNCHKWMQTPKGTGFLYARPERQAMLKPLVISWGWGNETPQTTAFVDWQQEQGTRDLAGYLSISAAIDFVEQHNWSTVRRDCHELVRYFRKRLTALTGLPPLTPDSPTWFSQMASFPLPSCDPSDLYRRLNQDYAIEIPIFRWQDDVYIRLSVQGYVTKEDVDWLLEALAKTLPQVRRS